MYFNIVDSYFSFPMLFVCLEYWAVVPLVVVSFLFFGCQLKCHLLRDALLDFKLENSYLSIKLYHTTMTYFLNKIFWIRKSYLGEGRIKEKDRLGEFNYDIL
jgi:hypothetical protein